jgi:hypothetical protein
MTNNKLPEFDSLEKLVEFLEAHDLSDYWDELPEVHFDVDIQRRIHLVRLDEDVAAEVTAIAKTRQVSSTKLINSWLREKVTEQAQLKGKAV